MDILVIGNGFDLAHGLKTDYGSFLKFLKVVSDCMDGVKADGFFEFDQLSSEYDFCYEYCMGMLTNEDKKEIREIFCQTATRNIWVKHFQSVYEEREQKGKTGWIDFESEISFIIQILDKIKQSVNEQTISHGDSIEVDPGLSNYINNFLWGTEESHTTMFSVDKIDEIEDSLVSDLNDLTRCLEIYLADFIEKQDLPTRLPDIQELYPQRVLSFNYTNTCEEHYFPVGKDIKYDYIHGKADVNHTVENCNIVLGIDEYLKEEEKQRTDFIRFKKYYQRIYKKTGCAYRDWLEEMKKCNENNLYIFGHSLDVTDADVLGSLILAPNTVTTIFYYSQKAFSQQIVNLVKIIGQDNLTAMVHGAHPSIIFKPQQDAEEI
ncbi:MAG: bacteriophage abortive infection AbiH family protein [Lachnospiraceae bacterium]|nr:bacteriophage abortive infection AbiH family protein [Lachnospiraceae bacterium]